MLLAAAIPLCAGAQTTPGNVSYTTALTPIHETTPYAGVLRLTYDADGTVHGYYFSADYSELYVPVVGGVSGDSIWLDIGRENPIRIQGTIAGGTISGGTIGTPADASSAFSAVPDRAPAAQ